ncbi:unnamed protein product, partial [Choristocarpus tenellus]
MFGVAANNMPLVDNVQNCSDTESCIDGVCLDGELGVYCQCYVSLITKKEVCMNRGGNITVGISKFPDEVTYGPEKAEFTLAVHAQGGSAPVLWNISGSSSDFSTTLYPSNGVLPPGSSVSVWVEVSPRSEIGGYLNASFTVEGLVPRTKDSVDVLVKYFPCKA